MPRRGSKGWSIFVSFDPNDGPVLSLVCPCGRARPREREDIRVLQCDDCGRTITFEQVNCMTDEAMRALDSTRSAVE